MIFQDRTDAGKILANRLTAYKNRSDVVVLGLPRGGVPVAYEVAQALNVPLDVFIVRKLGAIGHEELAIGAIASGGVRVLNEDIIRSMKVTPKELEKVTRQEHAELKRREKAYRGDQPPPQMRGCTVILVDDGLATGATMRAAVRAVRLGEPAHIVVAVPTAVRETCEDLAREADEVVCATMPEPFYGVGMWYRDFSQTTDEEVRQLLARASV
jgi:putative phosphoribosyl transferase